MATLQRACALSLLSLALVLACSRANAQTNHVVTTASTPFITSSQLSEWQRVIDTQHGISGTDPVGHKIGPNVAKRTGLGLNWYPVDIYKQTLCGTLHKFGFYDGLGDEADWNNYIIPSPSHAYVLEDVRPIADADELHKCRQAGDCMEAEITPDESFYENPWFTKSTEKSILEGREICTYGPWVWEEAHGNRPEIHPSELYWWKDTNAPSMDTYNLMVIQDDSNRFDRADDYNGTIVRPWSRVPRTGVFRIAFELRVPRQTPVRERLVFDIDELAAKNVVTKNDAGARQDSDDGKQHAIEFDGQIVLQVNELQPDDNIGVRFLDLTRDVERGPAGVLAGQILRGYIAITSKVGVSDRGKEGYHVIRVRSRRVSTQEAIASLAPAVAANFPQPREIVKPLRESLRVSDVNGQPKLVGDLAVRSGSGTAVGTRTVVSGFGGSTTDIQTTSGVIQVRMPEIVLAPIVTGTTHIAGRNAGPTWPLVVKAAGGTVETPVIPATVRLRRTDQIRVDVAPFYAPIREGKPSREDDSPFAEELNDVVKKKNVARTRKLFGINRRPIKQSNWTFSAKNLSNGEDVQVRIGEPAANVISVTVLAGTEPNASIAVNFPPELTSSVIQVTATAEMFDAYGNKGTASKTVWSHSLMATGENKTQLASDAVSVAAGLAGADGTRLIAASRINDLPNSDTTVKAPFMRCARMARLFALRAADDGSLDIGELTKLKKITEQCKTR